VRDLCVAYSDGIGTVQSLTHTNGLTIFSWDEADRITRIPGSSLCVDWSDSEWVPQTALTRLYTDSGSSGVNWCTACIMCSGCFQGVPINAFLNLSWMVPHESHCIWAELLTCIYWDNHHARYCKEENLGSNELPYAVIIPKALQCRKM